MSGFRPDSEGQGSGQDYMSDFCLGMIRCQISRYGKAYANILYSYLHQTMKVIRSLITLAAVAFIYKST